MAPTGDFRLREHACGFNDDGRAVLEQSFRCLETGEIEWRPIETVKQCDCKITI
jgi:hypothetical protein